MNILIIGSGGREHALAWKIKQSPLTDKLYCAPGNGGIAQIAECVDIAVDDTAALLEFATKNEIGLTVVGPEVPLVDGIVDVFRREGLRIFGPTRQAARLEGSKIFAKECMQAYDIPTASYASFTDLNEAKIYAADAEYPLVVKADGLAAGKGVVICEDLAQAEKALEQMMSEKIFKEAGLEVVIEDYLQGEEASILAISDGKNYIMMDTSQDHKRIFDDDLGPNTGGMGAYSPAPIVDGEMREIIETEVIEPMVRGMREDGNPFTGVLYAGLMLTEDGPRVLEFNVRFGDPEIQAILPRLKNDLVEVLLAACEGGLNKIKLEWQKGSCVCVVMSSGGYPGAYETGVKISGLKEAEKLPETMVFHAGTAKKGAGVVTSGGRVLGVTALGESIEQAIERVYAAVDKIKFDRAFFRRDIGAKALAYRIRKAQVSTQR